MAGGAATEATWSRSPPSLIADVLVVLLRDAGGPWESHPFEGGSDHVPFLAAGISAALIWKFPDPTYHTSLDRLEPGVVAVEELAAVGRGCAALIASLGWEDGSAVASAAATAWTVRRAVFDGRGLPGEGACAWGRWLDQAASDLAGMLGEACASSPGTAAALQQLRAAAARLDDECLRWTIGSGLGGRRGGGA